MTLIQESSAGPQTEGRHAGAPVEVDVEIEYLNQAGLASGLPAGLGDSSTLVVKGAHRADVPETPEPEATPGPSSHAGSPDRAEARARALRMAVTGILAAVIVLALACIALHAVGAAFTAPGGTA